MGKKGTKRRTRWKALPLAAEDCGSGNEDELQDDEQSTTSSGRIVVRMGERSYRSSRRYPYDRDRSKEPLVKLESKTFDEEEYTKITTPRQDVLFKKGYFGKRKNESSGEENNSNLIEDAEGEEGQMEQLIITNGFVDERGHYLVNGTSYEIYDPYTNTVTVMVGPPPYASGVTPPVLAALSCQPVPLQPVDWYPPGPGDWPPGPAWTPAYPPHTPKGPETGSSEGGSTTGSDEPVFAPPPPFMFPTGIPIFPIPYPPNGMPEGEEGSESGSQTPSACPESHPASPIPQETTTAGDGDGPREEEKFVPPKSMQSDGNQFRPQLNPAGPEFVPRYPIRPNGHEFVPNQHLQPNRMVFVPGVHTHELTMHPPPPQLPFVPPQATEVVNVPQQTIIPTPQHRLSPTELQSQEEATISKTQQSQTNEGTLKTVEPEAKVNGSKEKIVETQLKASPTHDTGQNRNTAIENSPKTAKSIPTSDNKPRISHATQTSPPDVSQPKIHVERKESVSPRHSAKKPPMKTVNNKQASVIDSSSNSRVSYARTVMNGLDQPEVVQNEQIIPNGMVNGTTPHDGDERIAAKESTCSKESLKDGELTNGHMEKRFEVPKVVLVNGKDEKERVANGKGMTTNKKFSRTPVMAATTTTTTNGNSRESRDYTRIERSVRITNGNSHHEKQLEDSDGDNFIPVESKRNNRSTYNGYSRNENKTKQLQKDQIAEATNEVKDSIRPKKDKTKQIVNNKDSTFRTKTGSQNKFPTKQGITEQPVNAKLDETETLLISDDAKDAALPEKIESDKSSTISELSSPTELSSGQTTPPNKQADLKLEETRADELNKSMEKLKENLEEEIDEKKPKKPKRVKKKVVKEEVKESEAVEAAADQPLPAFLQPPQDEMSHLDVLLGDAATNAILRSLRVNEPSIAKVNLFSPRAAAFPCDIYTKTNLSNMRATRPEEFFASIVENPVPVEPLKVSEKPKKSSKAAERMEAVRDSPAIMLKQISTAYKPSKKRQVKRDATDLKKTDEKSTEQRLGIVDAVKTWLESQEEEPDVSLVEEDTASSASKNGVSNPLHASSPKNGGQEVYGCKRVAVAATDDEEAKIIKTSTSPDSTICLADSPGNSPAPELAALVDARMSVDKYYSLSPRGDSARQSVTSETSEQEAIDALEYPFPRPASADVVDPGPFPTKELACKLQ